MLSLITNTDHLHFPPPDSDFENNNLNLGKNYIFYYMLGFLCVFVTIFCVFCDFRIGFDLLLYVFLTQNILWCANRAMTKFLNPTENGRFKMSSKKIKKNTFYVLYLNRKNYILIPKQHKRHKILCF